MQPSNKKLSVPNVNIYSPIFNFMKKAIFAVFGIYLFVALYACNGNGNVFSQKTVGTGEVVTDKRTVGSFTGVSLEFSGDVMLKQSNETAVDVVSQANIAQEVETVVEDNVLHIRFKNRMGNNYSYKKLTVYVVTPNIENIFLSGSGDLSALSDIKSNNLQVSLRGSGGIKLKNIDCASLDAHVLGSGNISMDGGIVQTASYAVTGSGDIGAEKIKARSVKVKTTGSGNIVCTAIENIDAKCTGSGDITYFGHPAQTVVKSTGSGSIQAK